MSTEETGTTTPTDGQQESDADRNFRLLREQNEALRAENETLRPLRIEKAIREAGFDPDSPEGKALARMAPTEVDADAVKTLAGEIGFEAPQQMTAAQQEAATQAKVAGEVGKVASGDSPPTTEDKTEQAMTDRNFAQVLATHIEADLEARD